MRQRCSTTTYVCIPLGELLADELGPLPPRALRGALAATTEKKKKHLIYTRVLLFKTLVKSFDLCTSHRLTSDSQTTLINDNKHTGVMCTVQVSGQTDKYSQTNR